MPTPTKHLSGDELYKALEQTGLERHRSAIRGVYDTSDAETMVIAQRILLDNGYMFTDCMMIEGHFYIFGFTNANTTAPYWVKLRYIVGGMGPQMTLMYHPENRVAAVPFDTRKTTFGTCTSDASKIIFEFQQQHGDDTRYFWMPALANSPLLT